MATELRSPTELGAMTVEETANADLAVIWDVSAQAFKTLTIVNFAAAIVAGGFGYTPANIASPLSQFAATTSLQLHGVISDPTGTGALVFGTSPTLTTPTISGAMSLMALTIGGDSNGSIEIGGISKSPYLDFHSATVGLNDYDVRLQATGGTYGTAGVGTLVLTAESFYTNATALLTPSTTGARSTKRALDASQYASGTVSGPTNLNLSKIWADDVDATNGSGTDYFVDGWTFAHYHGGGVGGRQGIAVYQYLTSAHGVSDNTNFAALASSGVAMSGNGGSGVAFATSDGQIFGAGLVGVAQSGAINLHNVTALEANSAMQAGSSVYAKSIIQLAGRFDDVVPGSGIDAMLWGYKQTSTAVHWTHGIRFGYPADANSFPFNSASTVFYVDPGIILNGFDLSAVTFASGGKAFASPGYALYGTGKITQTLSAANTSLLVGSGYSLTGSDATPMIDLSGTWNTSGAPIALLVNITKTAAGANSRLASFQIGGAEAAYLTWDGILHAAGQLRTNAGGAMVFNTRALVLSPADSVITLANNANTSFDRLQLGGTTSSFPALKRSSASLIARLADDSADAVFQAASFKVGANQVLGARDTGWTAMAGTPDKATAYDTSTVTLPQLAGRVASLQAALTTHGALGA